MTRRYSLWYLLYQHSKKEDGGGGVTLHSFAHGEDAYEVPEISFGMVEVFPPLFTCSEVLIMRW